MGKRKCCQEAFAPPGRFRSGHLRSHHRRRTHWPDHPVDCRGQGSRRIGDLRRAVAMPGQTAVAPLVEPPKELGCVPGRLSSLRLVSTTYILRRAIQVCRNQRAVPAGHVLPGQRPGPVPCRNAQARFSVERRRRTTVCFRPGICQVGTDRASVVRCRRSLLVAVGRCRCCHRCCQPRDATAPGYLPRPAVVLVHRPFPHRTDC
jgi:hypothetical protein